MTTHVLTIGGRRVRMNVHETSVGFGCHLSVLDTHPIPGICCGFSNAEYEHLYAWFNAIMTDLRANSEKPISVFDRHHVMTT